MIWDALAYRGAGYGPAPTRKSGPHFAASTAGEIEEGRERILDVAEKLIRRFGHAKTTMANISWELGTSRATLYRFFPTKEAMDEKVCARVTARALEKVREVVMDGDRASEQLAKALVELGRETRTRMTTDPHLHQLCVVSFQNQWSVATHYLREISDLVAAIVQHGLSSREFASGNSLEMGRFIVASMLVFIHPGLSELMRFDDEGLSADLDAHVRAIVELVKRVAQ